MSETEFGWPEGQGPIPLKKGPSALSSTDRALLMRRTGNPDVVTNPSTADQHKWFTGDDPNANPESQ